MANMKIVLLERVENLGQMGDVVAVRPGYARNFLLPQRKALRATKENLTYFEAQRAQLEAVNLKRRQDAEQVAKRIGDKFAVVVIRQASEAGHLYGSVSARDIAEAVTAAGVTLERRQVALMEPIKTLGLFPVRLQLHPDLAVNVTVNVARSEDEAKVQAERGQALIGREEEEDETGLVFGGAAEDAQAA